MSCTAKRASTLRALGALSLIGAMAFAGCAEEAMVAPDSGVEEIRDTGVDVREDAGQDSGVDAGQSDAQVEPTCTENCEFVEAALGVATSCARRGNGEVWCWGHNQNGEIGSGLERHPGANCTREIDLESQDCPGPQRVAGIEGATSVTAGGGPYSCALDGGEARCWGLQLISATEGEERARNFRPETLSGFAGATDLSAGRGHLCGVVEGEVRCFGFNGSGQLGNGDLVERRDPAAPTGVTGLPSGIVDVEVSTVDVTPSGVVDPFSCARTETEVFCWGSNHSGQLGDGQTHEECRPDMNTRYDCSTTAVQVALPVPDGGSVLSLALGARHACAVTSDGRAYCWGENALGQLGTGTIEAEPTPTRVEGLEGVAQIDASFRHTCARLATGGVRCWGGNQEGGLGDGSFDHGQVCRSQGDIIDCQTTPVAVEGIEDALHVALGYLHTCVVRGSGDISCWGWNERRGLGDGTEERRAEPVPVQGLP